MMNFAAEAMCLVSRGIHFKAKALLPCPLARPACPYRRHCSSPLVRLHLGWGDKRQKSNLWEGVAGHVCVYTRASTNPGGAFKCLLTMINRLLYGYFIFSRYDFHLWISSYSSRSCGSAAIVIHGDTHGDSVHSTNTIRVATVPQVGELLMQRTSG